MKQADIMNEIKDKITYDGELASMGADTNAINAKIRTIMTIGTRRLQGIIQMPTMINLSITAGTQFKNAEASDRVLWVKQAWWQDSLGGKTELYVHDALQSAMFPFETATAPSAVICRGCYLEFRPIPNQNGTLVIYGVQGVADLTSSTDNNEFDALPSSLHLALAKWCAGWWLQNYTEQLQKGMGYQQEAEKEAEDWVGQVIANQSVARHEMEGRQLGGIWSLRLFPDWKRRWKYIKG